MNITVYCGSNKGKNPHFAQAAHRLGKWIGENGHSLVYGGSSIGLMGVVARAVLENGGSVQGVEPQMFYDAGVAQSGLTELHVVESMSQRKAKMIELGALFVALPGGVGTLEEISEIMSRIRLGQTAGLCCLLNIDGFYSPFKAYLRGMVDEGFIKQADFDRYRFPSSVDELTAIIEQEEQCPSKLFSTALEMGC